ncbi:hypothetical protein [Natrinema halophilum]|uniref:Uncharacterized protein n=1 Tax=Natrinema halophilum TaxID=1699371 RepID=A0A7D5GI13_9EURY|nr:hypothetical protein [Natrinema halophilum]QLG49574.1 hypothetical protein HYG82_12225 [Natrinema halophilum]
MTQVHAQATAETNVYVGVYDLELIDDRIPGWPGLTIKERLRFIREVLEPIEESWSSNTTCVGLDEARALQPDQSRTVDDKPLEIRDGVPVEPGSDVSVQVRTVIPVNGTATDPTDPHTSTLSGSRVATEISECTTMAICRFSSANTTSTSSSHVSNKVRLVI